MFQWIKDNLNIIRVMNSCSYKEFSILMNFIMMRPDADKYFTSKFYIWNVIRPRDFYKMIAMWVIERLKTFQECPNEDSLMYAEKAIKLILNTTKDFQIRKSFIWNIMKQCPLVTVDTIQYASAEKLHYLLTGDKPIICDDVMRPIIDVVVEYRDHLNAYKSLAEDVTDV